MKVRRVETFKVAPRWVFVRLETDDGLVGWGEASLEGRADTVAAAVAELSGYLVGKDPRPVEDHFQVLYRGGFYRGGPVLGSALSGLEQALWDVKGKALGVPVYELLGGPARERVRVYNWIAGDRPQEVEAGVRAQRERGVTAVKMNATAEMHYIDSHAKVDAVLARVAAAREAGGPDFDIAIDFHGRAHRGMAKVLAHELEPLHPMFIEEPVPPGNDEALADVARHTSVPIALGERLYTRWDAKGALTSGVVDVLQPDVCHAGGILETRKIAAMAEAFDVAVALHCPLGPIALAACLQVDAATPNAFIQEQSQTIHYNQGMDMFRYLTAPLAYEDGYVALPTAPGLGIEVAEDVVREAARDAAREGLAWRNPVWRNEDGTFSEW
ncbi:MAG TPA: galactonate dehydratase [Trueperaceae bacterium]|nr:galactonate dehydratase [Trueperaceae bacterium]